MLSTSRARRPTRAASARTSSRSPRTQATFKKLAGSFDLIVDTDLGAARLQRLPGDAPAWTARWCSSACRPSPRRSHAFSLIGGSKRLAGSLIGGIAETQEMLDFCAEKEIAADVEVIPTQQINDAYERMVRSDVRYRFVSTPRQSDRPERRGRYDRMKLPSRSSSIVCSNLLRGVHHERPVAHDGLPERARREHQEAGGALPRPHPHDLAVAEDASLVAARPGCPPADHDTSPWNT